MLRNAAFLLATEGITRLAALALAVAIARSAGSVGYGRYTYALAYAATFAAFADFGTARSLTRAIAHDRAAAARLLGAALGAKGLALLPSLFVAVALLALQPAANRPLLLLFVVATAAQSLAGLLRAVFFALERMDLDTVTRFVERSVAIGGAGLALALDRGLLGVAVALVVAGFADLVAVATLVARRGIRPSLPVRWPDVVAMARRAFPLGLFGLVLACASGLPLFVLQALDGASSAGQYGAAATPFFAFIPPVVTVASVALPTFTRLYGADRRALATAFALLLRLFGFAGMAAAAGVAIVAPNVVALVYGPSFAVSGAALRILAIGLLGVFPTQVSINVLVASGRQNTMLGIDLIALAWQFGVDLAAIPRFGVAGAAFGTASAELLVGALFFLAAVRVAGPPALFPFLRALPAVAGLAAVAIPLLHVAGLGAAIAGGAVAYVALIVLAGAVTHKDLRLARSALHR